MPVNDYRQDQAQQDFDAQQQMRGRQRTFGFQTGLGTQAPTGAAPTAPPVSSMGGRQGPNTGAVPNYGIPAQTNYGAGSGFGRSGATPTGGSTSSFGQAWNGAGGGAQQSITQPAGSRALRRGSSNVQQQNVGNTQVIH